MSLRLYDKINWIRQQPSEKVAFAVLAMSEPVFRPVLQESILRVIDWEQKNASECWQMLDQVRELFPFITEKIVQGFDETTRAVISELAQYHQETALLCSLGHTKTENLLGYFGIWDKKTYEMYASAEKSLFYNLNYETKQAMPQLLRQARVQKMCPPHATIVPVVIERKNFFNVFDLVCDSLKEKGYFIAPSPQTMMLVKNVQDYLKLVWDMNVFHDENHYDLDNFLMPVTDWSRLDPQEAEKTALYSTLRIMHKHLVSEEEWKSVYLQTIVLIQDGVLKSAAQLAQNGAQKDTADGVRQFLMTTDLANFYTNRLTLLSEYDKKVLLTNVMRCTRRYLQQYCSDADWNRNLVEWYDCCSLKFSERLSNQSQTIARQDKQYPTDHREKTREE